MEQVTSSDWRRGAGDGEGRRRTRRELTETLRKVRANREGGGGEGVTKDSLMTSTCTSDRRGENQVSGTFYRG